MFMQKEYSEITNVWDRQLKLIETNNVIKQFMVNQMKGDRKGTKFL